MRIRHFPGLASRMQSDMRVLSMIVLLYTFALHMSAMQKHDALRRQARHSAIAHINWLAEWRAINYWDKLRSQRKSAPAKSKCCVTRSAQLAPASLWRQLGVLSARGG